jgi:DNA-binding NtrC family response regulator
MKQRILVVEDEEGLRELIAKILSGYGCEVKTARTANEARFLLSKEKFSDLLTDVNLPDMNGLDFVANLLTHRPERVWVMSGHVEAQDPRLTHVNVNGFIEKPFRAQSLKKMIVRAA